MNKTIPEFYMTNIDPTQTDVIHFLTSCRWLQWEQKTKSLGVYGLALEQSWQGAVETLRDLDLVAHSYVSHAAVFI